MKKILSFILALTFVIPLFGLPVFADNDTYIKAENCDLGFDVDAKSVVLMEAKTGEVIYSKNENEALAPASVTQIMTLLLVCEAISEGRISLADSVVISAYASSMGGSQVFLSEGETLSVEELIKCAVIASANDAAVALAELVAGSEEGFVRRMNERARELGLKSTNFENTTGLDDDTANHLTSAMDIAIMSQKLLEYDVITKYSSKWQDSIRNGEFVLTNTNRLVRFYDGCTGLKTGSTDKAGFCISATAERDGMHLIAVIMGAETRDKRNGLATKLLDFGFAEYKIYEKNERYVDDIKVLSSKTECAPLYAEGFSLLVKKSDYNKVTETIDIPKEISAPKESGETIGAVKYTLNGETLAECKVYLKESIDKITYFKTLWLLISSLFENI